MQLAVDACLTLADLDFENLLVVQNQIGRALLTLSLCTVADLHVADPFQKSCDRLNLNIVCSSGRLGVVGCFEDVTVWIELHHGIQAPLSIREVAFLEVDSAAQIASAQKMDDPLAHPLDTRRFEALSKLKSRLVGGPNETLENAPVKRIRAQR